MTKPNQYRKTYVLSADVPYHNASAPQKGPHSGVGTLCRGRVVWLEQDPEPANESAEISAYAEGVGIVLVAPSAVQPVR